MIFSTTAETAEDLRRELVFKLRLDQQQLFRYSKSCARKALAREYAAQHEKIKELADFLVNLRIDGKALQDA